MPDHIDLGVADYLADPTAPVTPRVKDSLTTALDTKPDMAADLARAARATGVPLATAQADPEGTRKQAQLLNFDVDNLTVASPRTAAWLTEPQNAAVAHDDINVLAGIEQLGRNAWALTKSAALGMGANALGVAQGLNEILDPFGDMGLASRRELNLNTRQFTTTALSPGVSMRQGLQRSADAAMPQTDNWLQAGVNSGFVSMVQNAPATLAAIATGNPALALGLMGANTGGGAYGEARDAGKGTLESLVHATEQGGVEMLTEKFPMDKLLKDIAAHSGIVKTWLHQVASDLPGELGATMMQDFADWANLHPDKPFMDYVASRPEALGETMIATLMGNTGHVALAKVAQAAAKGSKAQAPEQARAEQGQQQGEDITNVMKAAEASKLRERDPQSFEAFVAAATKDTPLEHVYIDAQTLVDTLSQGSPEKLAEHADVLQAMPSVMGQLDQAVSTGGSVEIPTSEFAAFAAGTPLAQSLIEHLRTSPEAMSMAEADEFMQTQGPALEAEVKKVLADQKVADEFTASGEKVKAGIAAQLDVAGRFTPDVNQAYASLTSSFYETQAARLGMTPEQLYDAHPLLVQAQGVLPDSFTSQLGQAGAKPTIAEMRERWGFSDAVSDEEIQRGIDQLFDKPAATESKPQTPAEDFEDTFGALYDAAGLREAGVEVSTNPTGKREAELIAILARKKGQGHGSKTMRLLTEAADKHGVTLKLSPAEDATSDNGGLSRDDLVSWYEGFGFEQRGNKMVRKPQVLEQAAPAEQPRGTYNPSGNLITLLRGADLSTFLHESGHFYLETLARLAAEPNAPQEVKDDFAILMQWMADAKGPKGKGPLEQPVYHGTPHEFDAFSLEHIGSGEGAQAYGWGLYFAGNKKIAEFYRSALTDDHARYVSGSLSLTGGEFEKHIERAMQDAWPNGYAQGHAFNVSAAVKRGTDLNALAQEVRAMTWPEDQKAGYLAAIAEAEKFNVEKTAGRLYHVDIPEDGAYLLWDKPFEEQPEHLQAVLTKHGYGKPSERLAPQHRTLGYTAGSELRKREEVQRLAADGIAGVKYLDGGSRDSGDGAYNYVVFDDSLVSIKAFEQNGDAPTTNGPGLRPDMGPAEWLALPVDERRAGHEKFARGFEAYLMSGKAPSQKLQPLFQRFRAWLVNLYQKVAALNVQLDPEVRQVMDRLLATEAEIQQAQDARRMAPVFDTKPESMTDPEWASYQKLGAEATADAEDELQTRSIRDMQWLSNARDRLIKQLQKDARETRKAVRAEVEAEVMGEPVYAAREFLKRGTLPEGMEWEGSTKLSIPAIKALYEGTPKELQDWQRLGYGKYGMLAEEGVNPDQVAEMFLFSSGDHLIESLLNAPDPKEKIEGVTDQRMLERHGDLTDEASIKEAADKAIHNDARLKFVATEANALSKAVGKKRVLAEAARNFAAQMIGAQRIRDLRPSRYTSAETKAAANAAKLAAKGDLEAAAMAKRNQLINGYAAKAVYEAQAEVDKALRLFARLDSPGVRKTIDPDYRDQIDAMLERFDLRKGESLRAIDKRKSLAQWIEAQRARGFEPVIDPDLVNEAHRQHFKDMTVEELRGLVDAVRNILHLGKLKNELLMAADKRAFDLVRNLMVDTVVTNAYRTNEVQREFNTVRDGLSKGLLSALAIHRKLPSLLREMGGGKDRTILWDAITNPLAERADWEAGRVEEATHKLHELFTPLVKEGALKRKLYIPEIDDSLSLEGRLAIALNWGNELNRARIMDGENWTQPKVDAVLKTLSPEHLQFVNGMWEYLDSYWPEIAAKQRRVTGVEPQRVEPVSFQATAADGSIVDMRGGYYPIKYETQRSDRSMAHEKAEALNATKLGLYAAATTRRGHTKARMDKVERPVRYDLMVPFQHVQQVIHDLAFHEYMIDANRLIGSRDFEMAVRRHYNSEVLQTLKDTLEAVAVGDVAAENGMERAVNWVRTGTTITGLGWNMMTSLLQPLGLTQSIARVGPKWMGRAIARCMTDAATLQNTLGSITEKSEFMRLRTTTFNREINEVSNKVKATWKPAQWGPVEQSFFWTIGKLQLVADIPTWLAQYDKSIAGGETDAIAVKLADQAVRDTQGSGHIGDLADVQRGNVWKKLWTTFYSFFSVAHNMMAESVADARRDPSHLPKLASDVFLIAFLPTALGELLKHAVRGDDWDDFLPDVLKQELGFLLGTFVGLRELGSVLSSDGKQPASPGGLRILGDAGHLYGDIYKAATEGAVPSRTRKDAVNVASILLHLPGAQVNRTIDGIEALATGKTKRPTALLFGAPRKAQ